MKKILKLLLIFCIVVGVGFCVETFNANAEVNSNLEKNDSQIVLEEGDNCVRIYADEWNYLVAQAGAAGFRITNNENNADIIKVNADGTIAESCLFYQNFMAKEKTKSSDSSTEQREIEIIFIVVVIVLVLICCILFMKMKDLSERIVQLEKEEVA